MSWYYAEGRVQRGPVGEEEFLQLVQIGAIGLNTLVWREGMAEWQTYARVAPATTGMVPPMLGAGPVCSECGRAVAESGSVAIAGRVLCPACKPLFVQRLIEGAPGAPARSLDPNALLAALAERGGYSMRVGRAFERACDAVTSHFWPTVGVAAVYLVIWLALGVSRQLPLIGCIVTLAQFFILGPLYGSVSAYFLRVTRRESPSINEGFLGFRQPLFLQMMLGGLIQHAVMFVIIMLAVVPMIVIAVATNARGETGIEPFRPGSGGFSLMMFVPLIVALLAVAYTQVMWAPSLLIMADTGMGFWQAMELSRKLVHQRLAKWILAAFVGGLVGVTSMALLCLPVLFVGPVLVSTLCFIWLDIREQAGVGMQSTGTPISAPAA
jgi:hypothetical protein